MLAEDSQLSGKGRDHPWVSRGGIKLDNIAAVAAAGANVFVSGSGVFGTPDYAATIAELRRRAQAAAA